MAERGGILEPICSHRRQGRSNGHNETQEQQLQSPQPSIRILAETKCSGRPLFSIFTSQKDIVLCVQICTEIYSTIYNNIGLAILRHNSPPPVGEYQSGTMRKHRSVTCRQRGVRSIAETRHAQYCTCFCGSHARSTQQSKYRIQIVFIADSLWRTAKWVQWV